MTKIKICGITQISDALYATNLGAWALGFNFYKKSKRYISPGLARDIIKTLPQFVEKVGVFVNASKSEVREHFEECGLTMLQFHGDEDPDYCSEFSKFKIIKAFRPKVIRDLEIIKNYRDLNFILLDGASQSAYGGTGEKVDLQLAKKLTGPTPLILAGGLNPENVSPACATLKPFAVDVTSGVELKEGVKSHPKMKDFFRMVKQNE